jgi:uncharacterized protein (DUF697 family)
MGIMRSTRGVSEIWKIISEVDLAQIREHAEQRFAVMVAGATADAECLALAMSERPGTTGVHPWIGLARLPLSTGALPFQAGLALLVVPDPDLAPDEYAALRRLREQGVPVVTVVTGATAMSRVGADLARDGETARVLVPDVTDVGLLARRLLPALRSVFGTAMMETELSVARHLPAFREAVIAELIEDTARANATFALTTGLGEMVPVLTVPLVLSDTIVLTKNQLLMAYKIALVAGKSGEPRELMGEIVGVIGGGLIFRQIARELVGLIPVIGIVPKVAVAYAGTRAIGAAVHVWAVQERRPTAAEVKRFYHAAMERGVRLANAMVDKARRDRKAPPALLPPPGPPAPDGGGDPTTL